MLVVFALFAVTSLNQFLGEAIELTDLFADDHLKRQHEGLFLLFPPEGVTVEDLPVLTESGVVLIDTTPHLLKRQMITVRGLTADQIVALKESKVDVMINQLHPWKKRERSVTEVSKESPHIPFDEHDINHLKNQVPVCYYMPYTTTQSWGLSRISEHNRPADYTTSQFTADSDHVGTCMDIFIVDSGVYTQHPTFAGRAYHRFIGTDAGKVEGVGDLEGHGTAVASLAAGFYHGVAKHARVNDVKVGTKDGVTDRDYLDGLNYVLARVTAAELGTSVVNISLGDEFTAPEAEMVIIQISFRSVVVVGAGNDEKDACNYTPGKMDAVITVGGSMPDDTYVPSSNYGSCVDVIAPGSDLIVALNTGQGSTRETGTSFATALVSGGLAAYTQTIQFPDTDLAKDFIELTASTADRITLPPGVTQANRLFYLSCNNPVSYYPVGGKCDPPPPVLNSSGEDPSTGEGFLRKV
eukprot:GHVN01074480.1.p1 GENE.GHVN01074480.1~~GHVN01074480.1.p1  ORF type:complete len:468 (-),score=43.26 GHVN01074480.1:87-1490(-)